MNDPVETSEILAFTTTVAAKSLSRAAVELGTPRATVSRRLARLEARLGVRLLRRTTRSLALTDAGEAFYRHAQLALEAVRRAEQSVRNTGGAVRGSLRIAVPTGIGTGFDAMLCAFAQRYPELQIHTHFSTRLVDLQRDGYDVAIRATTELEPGLVARTLNRSPLVAVASRVYLAEHGTPRTARDLRAHRCLLGFARGELPQTHWPLVSGRKVPVQGAFATNEIGLLCSAAVAGLGIALLPRLILGELLEQGELVHVLKGIVGHDTRVSVVYLEREFMLPQVRAFIDAVLAWAPGGMRARRRR